jgi:hypothetical protein
MMFDLLASRHLGMIGYATGVGASSMDEPSRNYTRDPYFTDGLRLVLFTSDDERSLDEIHWLTEWAIPEFRMRDAEESVKP